MKPQKDSHETENGACLLIAGPCSVDEKNMHEIYEIAKITVENKSGAIQKAIGGTRVVGMKSRTELSPTGSGMGMDFATYQQNLASMISGKSATELALPESARLSIEIFEKTNMLIATEVCSPLLQLLPLAGHIPAGKLLPWNPAVNQLGWPILEMAEVAWANGWFIGIKNGKWLGESLVKAESSTHKDKTPLEKVWAGLSTYALVKNEHIWMIHRGIEATVKGDYRSVPIHETAKRVKQTTHMKMLFDPSHSLGPKMRWSIVAATIDAMRLRMADGSYVYDGALIEAGTSKTDTDQHITLMELQDLAQEVAKFRNLTQP